MSSISNRCDGDLNQFQTELGKTEINNPPTLQRPLQYPFTTLNDSMKKIEEFIRARPSLMGTAQPIVQKTSNSGQQQQ